MLVSKLESCVNVLQHQESGFSVLQGELLHVGFFLLLTQAVNILPVVMWSILSQLEKILCQLVSRIVDSEGVVCGWDNAILGSCFSSVFQRCVAYSLVQNSIWENIVVSLDSHNESSEIEVFGWG